MSMLSSLSGFQHFVRLIRRGRAKEVVSHVSPQNAQWRDEGQHTLLHHAAAHSEVALVEALIRVGADVNARNHLGHTPLYHALDSVRLRVGTMLDIGRLGQEFRTHKTYEVLERARATAAPPSTLDAPAILWVAVWVGARTVVAALIRQAGARATATLDGELTTLHRFLMTMQEYPNFYPDVARAVYKMLLEEAGADIQARTVARQRTALHMVVEKFPHLWLFRDVMERAPTLVSAADAEGRTPLFPAVEALTFVGFDSLNTVPQDIVMALLEAGADPLTAETALPRRTPVHMMAALVGSLNSRFEEIFLKMLSVAGQDRALVTATAGAQTPLHFALTSPRITANTVEFLFTGRGANVHVKNHGGETPLFSLILHTGITGGGNARRVADIVHVLVEAGADVNTRNQDYSTILHVLAGQENPHITREGPHFETAALLLEEFPALRENVNAVDRRGKFPWDLVGDGVRREAHDHPTLLALRPADSAEFLPEVPTAAHVLAGRPLGGYVYVFTEADGEYTAVDKRLFTARSTWFSALFHFQHQAPVRGPEPDNPLSIRLPTYTVGTTPSGGQLTPLTGAQMRTLKAVGERDQMPQLMDDNIVDTVLFMHAYGMSHAVERAMQWFLVRVKSDPINGQALLDFLQIMQLDGRLERRVMRRLRWEFTRNLQYIDDAVWFQRYLQSGQPGVVVLTGWFPWLLKRTQPPRPRKQPRPSTSLTTLVAAARACDACGVEVAAHRCGRCRTQQYCSAECQARQWLEHAPQCIEAPQPREVTPEEAFVEIQRAIWSQRAVHALHWIQRAPSGTFFIKNPKTGNTLLLTAADPMFQDSSMLILELMARGSDVNAQNGRYYTLLHLLAEDGEMSLVEGVLQRWPEASVDLVNDWGLFPYDFVRTSALLRNSEGGKMLVPSGPPERPTAPPSVQQVLGGRKLRIDALVRTNHGLEVWADRALYSARSAYFRRLFSEQDPVEMYDDRTPVWHVTVENSGVLQTVILPFIEGDLTPAPALRPLVPGGTEDNQRTVDDVLDILEAAREYRVPGLAHWAQEWIIAGLGALTQESSLLMHDDFVVVALDILDFLESDEQPEYGMLYEYVGWYVNRHLAAMVKHQAMAVYVRERTRPGAGDLVQRYPFLPATTVEFT